MTRKKVKLAYITNDSARKATYKKRKKGFLKKMYELATLCEIKACAIIYSPYDAQQEVWPSTTEAQQVLSKFRRMPEMEKSKGMVNQEEFLRQRISKAAEQLKKVQKENREKEMTHEMYQCLAGKSLDIVDLNDLGWLIDQNLKGIYKRIEHLKKQVAASPPPLPHPKVTEKVAVDDGGSRRMTMAGSHLDSVHQEQMGAQRGGFNIMGMDQGLLQHQTSWYMDLMNQHDQMGGFLANSGVGGGGGGEGGNKMLMTFADYSNNVNPLWSSAFFP